MENKEIEEMANILCDRCMEINKGSACPYYDKRACFENRKKEATYYYEQGYRNVKDKVVLTKEEYDDIQRTIFRLITQIGELKAIEIPKAREETAEKYQTRIDELEEEIDILIKEQKEDRSYEIEQSCKEKAEKIFSELLKEVKEVEFGAWIELEATYVYKMLIDKAKQHGVEIKE